jgi:hypothetical protein
MTEAKNKIQPAVIEADANQPQNGAITKVAITPMEMLHIAVQQNADLDKLSKLMDLQERWEKNEARKAFVAAMAEFKKNPPHLEKNKEVDFTGKSGVRVNYRHTTLNHAADLIGEALSKHGLSFRWNVEQQQGGRVRVTCILQHAMGHSESVVMEAPADDSGNKNAIQQVGSTVTYLERYTLLAITGMASADQDNDGAAITGDIAEQIEWIQNACDMDELQRLFKQAFKLATEQSNPKAMKAIVAAKDARKKELQ